MVLNRDKYLDIINKIDKYLNKKSYHKYMTLFIEDYNNNYIYVSFNYVEKIKAYRMVWFDLNYLDLKHLDRFISEQIMTSFSANKLYELLSLINIKSTEVYNDDILGDRITIKSYVKDKEEVYAFDRFLPKKLGKLIDPLVLVFSYLPRSMELFLNEIFAAFDHLEDKYNYKKAIRFRVLKDKFDKLFSEQAINKGTKLYANSRVSFLEKHEEQYLAIVEDIEPVLVVIHEVNEDFTVLWCSCPKEGYCEHIYATLLAIKNKSYNSFYKVRYKGNNSTLLDRVRDGFFYFCFGVEGDNLLLVSDTGGIMASPIIEDDKCMFEVIEDDDECSLSKYLKRYDKDE